MPHQGTGDGKAYGTEKDEPAKKRFPRSWIVWFAHIRNVPRSR
jgi:hypothetical protein